VQRPSIPSDRRRREQLTLRMVAESADGWNILQPADTYKHKLDAPGTLGRAARPRDIRSRSGAVIETEAEAEAVRRSGGDQHLRRRRRRQPDSAEQVLYHGPAPRLHLRARPPANAPAGAAQKVAPSCVRRLPQSWRRPNPQRTSPVACRAQQAPTARSDTIPFARGGGEARPRRGRRINQPHPRRAQGPPLRPGMYDMRVQLCVADTDEISTYRPRWHRADSFV
jgi:hypothetical protein